jgi:hypothetical protein
MAKAAGMTDGLTARLDAALAEIVSAGADCDPAAIISAHGITLVEISRTTFLIDQRVHEGVLWRLNNHLRRHPAHRLPAPEIWKGLIP